MFPDAGAPEAVANDTDGEASVWRPRPGLVMSRVRGRMTLEHANAIMRVGDEAVRVAPKAVVALHDWSAVESYEVIVHARMFDVDVWHHRIDEEGRDRRRVAARRAGGPHGKSSDGESHRDRIDERGDRGVGPRRARVMGLAGDHAAPGGLNRYFFSVPIVRGTVFVHSRGMERTRLRLALLAALATTLSFATPPSASAGGYDTPMLYSARHMGMGGAAVGYVGDASALFHNPAGLGQVRGLHLLGDLSLLIGDLQANPIATETQSIGSETTIAPAFLLGGALRVHDRLVLGLGAFPVAAAGGEYRYDNAAGTATTTDRTDLTFIEVTPALAVNFDEIGLRIGASYRVTFVSLERFRQASTAPSPNLFIEAKGWNLASFRFGIQYQPPSLPNLQLGFNYRHKTVTELESVGDSRLNGLRIDVPINVDFVLPARIAFGGRYNFGCADEYDRYEGGIAVDFLYAFNSQNEEAVFDTGAIGVTQVFDWSNEITFRVGGEYRLLDRRLPLRLGYSFDGKTGNPRFPTAFGTPPAPTHILTLGGGYDAGPWQLNVAYARRMGSTTITQAQIDAGTAERLAAGADTCGVCGGPGNYEIALNGLYVDFSYNFDLGY